MIINPDALKEKQLATLQASILFEDSRFIFINKPSGMAVHGGSGKSLGVIEAMRELRPEAPYLELAHRLDRDTSGCLVIAKRRSALRAFQKLQENRGVDKFYLALVKGQWQGSHQKVDAPLLKKTDKSGAWTMVVDNAGKRSVSYFSPLTKFEVSTLVKIKIITGRTHQIRVHSQSIGFPIAGDEKYGDVVFNQKMSDLGLQRLFLHAHCITFTLPDIEPYHIEAPLDEALEQVLKQL